MNSDDLLLIIGIKETIIFGHNNTIATQSQQIEELTKELKELKKKKGK